MSRPGSPQRFTEKLTVQVMGEETLVYDERRHRAFCLNRTTSAVWRRCDGLHSVSEISEAATLDLRLPVSEELVVFALRELENDGLLQVSGLPTDVPNVSRRELMRRLGAGAAAMMPAIAALTVPRAAQALSGVVSGSRRGRGDAVSAPGGETDSGSR